MLFSVVKDPSQVYTGGILATLMPELIAENFPTVKNNPGLLDKKGTLGLEHEECIDRLTLDYGILDVLPTSTFILHTMLTLHI